MLDFIVSKEELVDFFTNETIKDSPNGWIYNDNTYIEIIALHEKDPKYVHDVTSAQFYKLISLENK